MKHTLNKWSMQSSELGYRDTSQAAFEPLKGHNCMAGKGQQMENTVLSTIKTITESNKHFSIYEPSVSCVVDKQWNFEADSLKDICNYQDNHWLFLVSNKVKISSSSVNECYLSGQLL